VSATLRSGAAGRLRQVALDESADNGARLHCLIAADLLAPDAGPTAFSLGNAQLIRRSLRLIAQLRGSEFADTGRLAARHARRALLDLDGDLDR
jgi:hypothetical protein